MACFLGRACEEADVAFHINLSEGPHTPYDLAPDDAVAIAREIEAVGRPEHVRNADEARAVDTLGKGRGRHAGLTGQGNSWGSSCTIAVYPSVRTVWLILVTESRNRANSASRPHHHGVPTRRWRWARLGGGRPPDGAMSMRSWRDTTPTPGTPNRDALCQFQAPSHRGRLAANHANRSHLRGSPGGQAPSSTGTSAAPGAAWAQREEERDATEAGAIRRHSRRARYIEARYFG